MDEIKTEAKLKKRVVNIDSNAIQEETTESTYFLKILRPEDDELEDEEKKIKRFYIPEDSGRFLRICEKENMVPSLIVNNPEGSWDTLELNLSKAQKLSKDISAFFKERVKFCFTRSPSQNDILKWQKEIAEKEKEKQIQTEKEDAWRKISSANNEIKNIIEQKKAEIKTLDILPPPGYVLAQAPYFWSKVGIGNKRSFQIFWRKQIQLLKQAKNFELAWRNSYYEKGKNNYFIKENLVAVIIEKYKNFLATRQTLKPKWPKKHFCMSCGNLMEWSPELNIKPNKWSKMVRCQTCTVNNVHPKKHSKHCIACGKLFFRENPNVMDLHWNGLKTCLNCRPKF